MNGLYKGGFHHRLRLPGHFQIADTLAPERIDCKITYSQRSDILEKMRSLTGIYTEILQTAFHYDLRLRYLVPSHRNTEPRVTRPPSARAYQHVRTALRTHKAVYLLYLGGHFLSPGLVERAGLDEHHIGNPFYMARAESVFRIDQSVRGIHRTPVHGLLLCKVRDGPYLQYAQYGILPFLDIHVQSKLHLHLTAQLMSAYIQQIREDTWKRNHIILEDVGKRYHPHTFRECAGAQHLALVVPSGSYLGKIAETLCLRYRELVDVDSVIDGRLELLRLQIQCIHRILSVLEREPRCRHLHRLCRISGTEAKGLAAVHHEFPKAEGDIDHSVLGLLPFHGIEIHGLGHSGGSREEIAPVLRSAYILNHHSHLLLTEQVASRVQIGPARRQIDRGVHTLYRFS